MDAYAVALSIVLALVLVIQEWVVWFLGYEPQPLIWTLYVALVVPYPVYRLRQIRKELPGLKFIQDANKVVVHYLEQLRKDGYSVFHDIEGDGFDIDHVVVGKNGVFIVESIIYSRPAEGKARIYFDGASIRMDEAVHANELIEQGKAKKSWLEEMLRQSIGKHFPIRPVILFPGWYIDATKSAYGNDLWVLNPKNLPLYIQNTSEKIKEEDYQLIAYYLSRYSRGHEC